MSLQRRYAVPSYLRGFMVEKVNDSYPRLSEPTDTEFFHSEISSEDKFPTKISLSKLLQTFLILLLLKIVKRI